MQKSDPGTLLVIKIIWPKTFLWRMSIDIQVHHLDLEIGRHPPDSGMTLLQADGRVGKVNHCISLVWGLGALSRDSSKLYACFKDDETVYLVTEYVEGRGMNQLEDKE